MKMPGNLGMMLLAVYLILVGAIGIFHINLGEFGIILPILALASGILLLLKR